MVIFPLCYLSLPQPKHKNRPPPPHFQKIDTSLPKTLTFGHPPLKLASSSGDGKSEAAGTAEQAVDGTASSPTPSIRVLLPQPSPSPSSFLIIIFDLPLSSHLPLFFLPLTAPPHQPPPSVSLPHRVCGLTFPHYLHPFFLSFLSSQLKVTLASIVSAFFRRAVVRAATYGGGESLLVLRRFPARIRRVRRLPAKRGGYKLR